jgi:hypothetical protein
MFPGTITSIGSMSTSTLAVSQTCSGFELAFDGGFFEIEIGRVA